MRRRLNSVCVVTLCWTLSMSTLTVLLRSLSDDCHDLSSELRPVCSSVWSHAVGSVAACGRECGRVRPSLGVFVPTLHTFSHSTCPIAAVTSTLLATAHIFTFPPTVCTCTYSSTACTSAIPYTVCTPHVFLIVIMSWPEALVDTALLV